MSLAMDQARRDIGPAPTPPLTSVASGSSNVAPPVVSAQPETPTLTVEAGASPKPITPTVCLLIIIVFVVFYLIYITSIS